MTTTENYFSILHEENDEENDDTKIKETTTNELRKYKHRVVLSVAEILICFLHNSQHKFITQIYRIK